MLPNPSRIVRKSEEEFYKNDYKSRVIVFGNGNVKVIVVANVTDEEKFYAIFDDPRSKEFDAKFNNVDEVYKLEKM